MHHYRQALMRMRQGDSDRDIARSRLMGRRSAAAFRAMAVDRGWLADEGPLPDDEAIAGALVGPKRASTTVSSLAPLRDQIGAWFDQGVSGVVIHMALKREHGYTGSYSAVRRMLGTLKRETPPDATVRPVNVKIVVACVHAAIGILWVRPEESGLAEFRSGLRVTQPAGVQLRVRPLQRAGFALRAAW